MNEREAYRLVDGAGACVEGERPEGVIGLEGVPPAVPGSL